MFLFLLNLRGVNEKCHFLKDYLGCAKTEKIKTCYYRTQNRGMVDFAPHLPHVIRQVSLCRHKCLF